MVIDWFFSTTTTVVVGIMQPVIQAIDGLVGQMPFVDGFVVMFATFDKVLPLTEVVTTIGLITAIRIAAMGYRTAKEGAGWIPFVGIGSK